MVVFFSLFEEKFFEVTGVDISWENVRLCQSKKYCVSQGTLENTGMPESEFGFINAWAVFDCSDQNRSLHHLLGRLSLGGVLLLSGKNDSYYSDDSLAVDAERAAASKLFPNGFTDFSIFEKAVHAYGGELIEVYYAERRGDISQKKVLIDKPTFFYEWVAIIKKKSETPAKPFDFILSNPFSKRLHCV